MKKLLFLIGILSTNWGGLFAQEGYWQQRAEYRMFIRMDEAAHQFSGEQSLTYYNHSPDTLRRAFYHLYFNAFQPGSMMDIRNLNIVDADPRVGDRISKLTESEIGYHHIGKLLQDNQDCNFYVNGTILEVDLATPLAPGDSTVFYMEFDSQVPLQIRRSGRNNKEGIAFSMTQWYPKMCEYDTDGWHANPYVGREFHGIWGDFDVTIDMASNYVLGGTGVIQNPEDVKNGYGGIAGKPTTDRVQWHFVAKNVHDFAWAADPDYVHLQHPGPNDMTLHFLVQPDTAYLPKWEKLPELTARAFEFMNTHFGVYPYPQYSVIQGGDGGMEYPMATLITGNRKMGSLLGVTVHELIHSWYQGMLATNEAKYPWMDEGFTTFASDLVMAHLYDKKPDFEHFAKGYARLAKSGVQEPMTCHADHYNTNFAYGTAAYTMGALVPVQLFHIIGESLTMQGMKNYFDSWAFKHPRPDNFKRIMEQTSGIELDWFFENWVGTTKHIDVQVYDVKKKFKESIVHLKNLGEHPMPTSVLVTFKDGSTQSYFIPLRIMRGIGHRDLGSTQLLPDWPWTHPDYVFSIPKKKGKIVRVEVFPNHLVPDIDPENNTFQLN